jgi:predicted rRNA methylase YqxC with S4 and FtsJ domains
MRLDQYISLKLGLSRNRAQFLIDSKLVKVNGVVTTKNSLDVSDEDILDVSEDKRVKYVARSAIKLE